MEMLASTQRKKGVVQPATFKHLRFIYKLGKQAFKNQWQAYISQQATKERNKFIPKLPNIDVPHISEPTMSIEICTVPVYDLFPRSSSYQKSPPTEPFFLSHSEISHSFRPASVLSS